MDDMLAYALEQLAAPLLVKAAGADQVHERLVGAVVGSATDGCGAATKTLLHFFNKGATI